MARPHIEFFQSQALAWESGSGVGWYQDVQRKLLSRDEGTGATSALLCYPPGWSRTHSEYLAADEEFFVLDGTLTINGRDYTEQCYGHLPEGFVRQSGSSEEGAVVLTFLSAEPATHAGAAPEGLYDPKRLVEYVNALETELSTDVSVLGVELTDEIEDGFSGFAHVLFREDPYTHDQTWMLAARPLWKGGVIEIHPVVEEMYLVAGDLATDRGLMMPGAYFWRPPGLAHGPFGSKTGNLLFFRTVGGPLSTEFQPGDEVFSWEPAHAPVLPPELAHLGRLPGEESRCF
jgi:hypothetical protein